MPIHFKTLRSLFQRLPSEWTVAIGWLPQASSWGLGYHVGDEQCQAAHLHAADPLRAFHDKAESWSCPSPPSASSGLGCWGRYLLPWWICSGWNAYPLNTRQPSAFPWWDFDHRDEPVHRGVPWSWLGNQFLNPTTNLNLQGQIKRMPPHKWIYHKGDGILTSREILIFVSWGPRKKNMGGTVFLKLFNLPMAQKVPTYLFQSKTS